MLTDIARYWLTYTNHSHLNNQIVLPSQRTFISYKTTASIQREVIVFLNGNIYKTIYTTTAFNVNDSLSSCTCTFFMRVDEPAEFINELMPYWIMQIASDENTKQYAEVIFEEEKVINTTRE